MFKNLYKYLIFKIKKIIVLLNLNLKYSNLNDINIIFSNLFKFFPCINYLSNMRYVQFYEF